MQIRDKIRETVLNMMIKKAVMTLEKQDWKVLSGVQ
jgi:hypothetical protein